MMICQSIYARGSTPQAGPQRNSAMRQRLPKACLAQGTQAHAWTPQEAHSSNWLIWSACRPQESLLGVTSTEHRHLCRSKPHQAPQTPEFRVLRTYT